MKNRTRTALQFSLARMPAQRAERVPPLDAPHPAHSVMAADTPSRAPTTPDAPHPPSQLQATPDSGGRTSSLNGPRVAHVTAAIPRHVHTTGLLQAHPPKGQLGAASTAGLR